VSKELLKSQVLRTAARLFLEQGYTATTVREISKRSEVEINAMVRAFGNKENILCQLVEYVLEEQFLATEKFLKDITDDPVLFYAAETTLQLYMAESSEHIRDLYSAAYSMPESSALIMRNIAGKLEQLFQAYQPDLEAKDFYEFEIATGGVMRGFMTVPCDLYFTMERKVHVKGFSFTRQSRAWVPQSALEADVVYGDSFTRTEEGVLGIGNNVSLVYEGMDFGEASRAMLTLDAATALSENPVTIRFEREDGRQLTSLAQFRGTGRGKQTFEVEVLPGMCRVSFVFLPGSQFDFYGFQFDKA